MILLISNINVLIVEDDPMVADIHKRFVSALDGFKVVGEAKDGSEALKILKSQKVDLMILDIYMPKLDGIDTLKEIRRKQTDVDVILITAAQETDTLKDVIRFGAFDYIIKPFRFERFQAVMMSYKKYHNKMKNLSKDFSQADIDNVFIYKNKKNKLLLPKGLQESTLKRVVKHLKNGKGPLSAAKLAEIIGISRVTARRYLEYLVTLGYAVVQPKYKKVGRPSNYYKLVK